TARADWFFDRWNGAAGVGALCPDFGKSADGVAWAGGSGAAGLRLSAAGAGVSFAGPGTAAVLYFEAVRLRPEESGNDVPDFEFHCAGADPAGRFVDLHAVPGACKETAVSQKR